MATVNDVAQRAGVSDTIVCAVLAASKGRSRCSAETRQKVLQAARELGYRRHPLYTAMRTGRTHIVGLYMGGDSALLNHPHTAYGLSNVHAALTERGYSPLIASLDKPEMCDFRLMDGLIVLDCRRDDAPHIERAARALPTFGWTGTPYEPIEGVYSPGQDFLRKAAQLNHEIAAKYLYDLGHRHIALIEPWGGRDNSAMAPFRRVAQERALNVELNQVFDHLARRVYLNTMGFLDQERLPTAFYVLDDEVAHRIIEKLSWRGLAVPSDVTVFSRQTDTADTAVASGITGIYTDWRAVWRSLVNQYVDVIEGKRTVEQIEVTAPSQRVVERDTCARRTA